MGLLDQLKGEFTQKIGGTDVDKLLGHALDLINNPAIGGLHGLVEIFRTKGLGGIIDSWIATGANQPITAEQILQVVGTDRVQQIAQKIGMSKEDLSQHLSQLLPQIVDKLTPNGKLPSPSVFEDGLSILKKSIFGKQ